MSNAHSAYLSRGMLFLFALPAILQGFMHAPAQSLLQGIYAKHAALPLAALGTAVLITRIFDAVTDPLIGWLSDKVHRRTGTRKHFVVVGTFVTMLGLWFLFRPPEEVGIAYFTAWFMVAYLGWTIVEIPYRAWSFELSSDYVVRTRIQTWLGLFVILGTLFFYFTPYLGKSLGLSSGTELDFTALGLAAIVIVILVPLFNFIAVWRVHDGQHDREKPQTSFADLRRAVLDNGPLLYFTAMFMVIGLVMGISQGAAYLYLDAYLGLEDKIAAILGASAIITIIAIPLWGWLCQKFQRHKVWAVSAVGAGICLFGYSLIPTGGAGQQLVTLNVLAANFFIACTIVAAPSILGDITDYGRWRFRQDHAGLYMAFYSLVQKTITGLGVALGLFMLDIFDFDATAASQTARGALGMHMTMAYVPCVLVLLIAPVVWKFPLGRERHAEIMREVEARP